MRWARSGWPEAYRAGRPRLRQDRHPRHNAGFDNSRSVHEELPFPHFVSCCASKGGIKITRDLALQLAPNKITINSIAPGAIETSIRAELLNDPAKLKLLENIPLGRLGKPEDVAGIAGFRGSEDSDYFTRVTILVEGGLLWNCQEQWTIRSQ
jgi:glucose 1-dehydrogenase